MDGTRLQDLVAKGLGAAGRKMGTMHTVFRPRGTDQPLAGGNRVIELPAAFSVDAGRFARGGAYGQALWCGAFDASYTRPGDYLVGATGTYFVAAQRPLLPVQCVLTNSIVSVTRAAPPGNGGYGSGRTARFILRDWPAGIVAAGAARGDAAASDGTRRSAWTVLLPLLPNSADPAAADIVTDGTGRRLVLDGAEASELGWRCTAREISA